MEDNEKPEGNEAQEQKPEPGNAEIKPGALTNPWRDRRGRHFGRGHNRLG